MYVSVEKDSVASSVRCSYMRDAFDRSGGELIELFEEQIDAHGIVFDTVVAIGLSGMMVMPLIGYHYGVNMLALRKNGAEDNHTYEGDINAVAEGVLGRKWLLIDDFVSSGGTADKAIKLVNRFAENFNHKTEFVGVYGYNVGMNGATKYYYPRKGGYYEQSSKKRIHVDGQQQFVDASLYHSCLGYYERGIRNQVTNLKTYVIQSLRDGYYDDFNLDEVVKILVDIENTKK